MYVEAEQDDGHVRDSTYYNVVTVWAHKPVFKRQDEDTIRIEYEKDGMQYVMVEMTRDELLEALNTLDGEE